ncbi:hypothetical protein EVB39_041 [Rhizobium phage RHph_TM3_3_9]|nr:hypothetical protein EVB39_041 [Rhizobium phage RHph_TM3_3_9]QIG67848.1 hypothetical protein EVB53_046 [Rhizobium phage RHph_Y60]QIG68562.1 hypothetical protein EVB66_041 [Rhizobium phage RHph_TM3_3_13]QIG74420.1 hypothetical protein EVC09_040 [Rhizobium phage RHph_TM3_3_10]QXV74534.1 hypothetical protein [Rhizobium phage RHEph19]
MTVLNDIFEISSITVRPQRNDEVEGIGSGQIITAELATPLWSVEIETPVSLFDQGRRVRAVLNDLNRPGQKFDVYDPIAQYPRSDPDGSILGTSTVQIDTVGTDGTITLKGLPAGYQISAGDFMQIDFAGRRGFFEASQDATASSGGVTGAFRVFPTISAATPVNTTVILKQPKIQCQMIPSELEYATADSSTWKMTGFRMRVIQKI